jgi:hypothetical protein
MIHLSTTDIINQSANVSVKVALAHDGRISFAISYGGTDTHQHIPNQIKFSLTRSDARLLARDIQKEAEPTAEIKPPL